ncbi:phage portal protein, lambda family [Acetobacteraceae bacterium AT-5844]|nr:phage portal protein, lambda family [Acetobacteraceae bacterium AT-5844]
MSGKSRRAKKAAAQASKATNPASRGGPGGMAGAFAYDAANMFGAEMGEWNPWLRSADGEINQDRDRMVARSRDVVRNDGWAAGGITRIVDSAVGSQFRLVAKPDYRALALEGGSSFDPMWADEFGRAAEAEWRLYANDPGKHCDAARQLTMTQIFWLALRHKLVDGDALAPLLWTPERVTAGGARYATTVQLIDPDRLSNPHQQQDTRELRGGCQLDDLGVTIGYHIRQAHQGDVFLAQESMRWDYFERETPWGRPVVVHDFEPERRGQHRGTSVVTPVLGSMRMLSRYDAAELQQALLQTIFANFIQSPFDPADVQNALNDDGALSEYQKLRNEFHEGNTLSINGARIPVLAPGEEIKSVMTTRPNSGFEAFQQAVLRRFAAATGQSAEQLSWDYSKTNYSSARAAMLEAWKTLKRRRDNFAIGFANPIYGAWLEEAIDRKRVPLPRNAPAFALMRTAYMACRWIGPARGWVDPVAERQGAVLGMEAAMGTLEDECAEQGRDFEEVLDQRALEVAMMKQRGLPLPTWAMGSPLYQSQQAPQNQPKQDRDGL